MVPRYCFFVDTVRQSWVCIEQENGRWLILGCREIEDAERDDFLRNRRLTCVQDKESIALANLELTGLDFRLSGFRVHRKPQSCFLRL